VLEYIVCANIQLMTNHTMYIVHDANAAHAAREYLKKKPIIVRLCLSYGCTGISRLA
jgi:histidinol-phosphate/aromatic aminotransferase/cobyric acid decarboxylase-like protein